MKISSNRYDKFENGFVLTVTSSPVFQHYSDVEILDDGNVLSICHIDTTDFIVIAVLCILLVACNGAVDVACLDSWIDGNVYGGFVPLLYLVQRKVDDIRSLEIICWCSFDPVASLVAHHQSSKVDSA